MVDTNLTHDLLSDIEIKDRRFRFTQTLFFFLVALMLVVLLVASYQQQVGVKKVTTGQTKTLAALTTEGKSQTDKINDLQKHIDCVVALFQQPDRSSLVISDIENCSLKQLQDSADNSKTSAAAPSQPSTSNSSSVATTTPVTAPTSPSTGSGGSNPIQQPDPLTILGLPVCVPFTGLCVR